MLGEHLLGWEHAGAVELDDWRRALLSVRFAGLPLLADVRAVPEHVADFGRVGILTAGFPCQPFSVAGKSAGADDPRNGWPWTLDAIRAVNPPEVFLENVPGLLQRSSRGYFGRILVDLMGAGYGVRWGVLSAADVGAHHLRKRLWIRGLRGWQPTPTGEVFGRVDGDRLVSINASLFGASEVLDFPEYGSAWGGQAWGGQAWGVEMHPTPRVSDITSGRTLDDDGYRVSNGQRFGANLHDAAKAIHATPSICGNYNAKGSSQTSGDGLATQAKMHATPSASAIGAKDVDRLLERREECRQRHGNGNGFGLTIGQEAAVAMRHPTPRSEDSEKTGPHRGANDTLWSAVKHATPNARDDKGSPGAGCLERGGRESSLPAEVARHATPAARDWRSTKCSDATFERNARPLSEEVGKALHATPMSSGNRHSEKAKSGRPTSGPHRGGCNLGLEDQTEVASATAGLSLSPTWVEAYQGFPVGWTDPAATVDLDTWPEFTRHLWTTTRDSFTDWPWSPLAPSVKGLTRKRISALGDAQVPQCMAEAYRLLSK